jgi:hypothetical protein
MVPENNLNQPEAVPEPQTLGGMVSLDTKNLTKGETTWKLSVWKLSVHRVTLSAGQQTELPPHQNK